MGCRSVFFLISTIFEISAIAFSPSFERVLYLLKKLKSDYIIKDNTNKTKFHDFIL